LLAAHTKNAGEVSGVIAAHVFGAGANYCRCFGARIRPHIALVSQPSPFRHVFMGFRPVCTKSPVSRFDSRFTQG